MDKIKMAMVTHFYPDPEANTRFYLDFANGLRKNGVEVDVLTNCTKKELFWENTRILPVTGGIRDMKDKIKNYDVINLQIGGHGPQNHFMLHFLPYREPKPKIVSFFHNSYLSGGYMKNCPLCLNFLLHAFLNHPAMQTIRYPMMRYVAKQSDACLMNSEWSVNSLKHDFGIKNVERIYFQIDLDLFKGGKEKAREELGLPKDKIIAFALGFIDFNVKEYDTLAKALPLTKEDFLCIMRDDPTIKELTMPLRIEKKLKYISPCSEEEFTKYVVASDFVVVPRKRTIGGTSSIFATSLAAGKPVIISDIDSCALEYAKDNCLIYKVRDEKSLAEQLDRMTRDATLRKKLGAAARKFAEKNMDIQVVGKSIRKIIEKVL